MKIVHICLCGVVTDNFSYQDNLLSKYHVKLGHNVTFIASQWSYDTKGMLKSFKKSDYMNDDGVKMLRLKMRGKDDFSKKYKRFYGLSEALKIEHPDIIFIHGCQFPDIDKVVNYLKENKVTKVYVDNHADFSNSARNWVSKNILHKILWRHCAQLIEPYTTRFYGVLPARVDFLKDIYKLPAEKCELLVMGADDDKVEEAQNEVTRKSIRAQYNIKEDEFLVMTGGKIDPAKKQTLLLMEAVNQIKDPRVKLIIFGSVTEDLKDKLNSLCDGNKIQYIGWIQSQDSYKYFAAADLVTFPGRHSVFWEQVAALGIPMVVKYWEGTTHVDLGGNTKFLYRDSTNEIKQSIESLVDSEEYNNMKRIALKKGVEMFSYKEIAKRSINSNE
ncbi:glycosyltransferase family 4 protein [Clostridium magnum]|uniref:Glycosyl transferases group 1 n=1 Tax=Clostridium magnum DSM 2767 TaxID=1121326 RepID=A0A162RCY1_9CLOT|nr:glycosyltransferase family 4 protein [Clostridium magnum]KZL89724.1 glycosyl transferases group 1 [Clostridium magnum DSM 2767]SHH64947.1 Glycosyltransferase involved in cell wall bisynthesis [Clostridium magnum DSM 2767]